MEHEFYFSILSRSTNQNKFWIQLYWFVFDFSAFIVIIMYVLMSLKSLYGRRVNVIKCIKNPN